VDNKRKYSLCHEYKSSVHSTGSRSIKRAASRLVRKTYN